LFVPARLCVRRSKGGSPARRLTLTTSPAPPAGEGGTARMLAGQRHFVQPDGRASQPASQPAGQTQLFV